MKALPAAQKAENDGKVSSRAFGGCFRSNALLFSIPAGQKRYVLEGVPRKKSTFEAFMFSFSHCVLLLQ